MQYDIQKATELIRSGGGILGIEFGSTRIKAVLIAPDATPLAAGSHTWENQLVDGIWTYSMSDVFSGLRAAYQSLAEDAQERYGEKPRSIAALGISGMMHGYVALDRSDELLVPFRTWRNNITHEACRELTPELDFAIPQRWTVAHLYQSVLDKQPHVPNIARLTTLAGYVHYKLTGQFCVGIGEASGIFPVDSRAQDWDRARIEKLDKLLAARGAPLKALEILPRVLPAGREAGRLSPEGAALLDPSGTLQSGALLCPPEGDAGTGMVATSAVRPRSGNVSAGTSVFAMIVLEKSLAQVHEEIDIVATPDGRPVAMAHSNNGSSDLDAWLAVLGQAGKALGADVTPDKVYEKLLPLALAADPDAGGLLSINYVSGEHITGFSEGRPLFVRAPESRFSLENLLRSMYYSSLCAMRMGIDILREKEGVVIEELRGHGGFFKGGTTGQRMMAAALGVPVSIPASAGEGGAFGMAVLAAYSLEANGQGLPDFIDALLAGSVGEPVPPDPRDEEGFNRFFERHRRGLAIEREAICALR